MNDLNCREQILEAVRSITAASGTKLFTPKQVVNYMKSENSIYAASTIRTHITSRCCRNVKHHHRSYYEDFERVKPGVYKLLSE